MPNRVVRDAILDSERYHACPIESRLLYLELLLCADDYGLVPIADVFLRRHTTVCEGRSAAQIATHLAPLLENDLIRPYDSADGGRFAYLPRWKNRPEASKPKWPLPPRNILDYDISDAMSTSKWAARAIKNQQRAKKLPRSSWEHSGTPLGPSPETETEYETETETEKKEIKTKTPASAGPADPAAELWSFGVEVLTRDGKKPLTADQARSFIGSLRKTWADETVLDALQAAVGTDDPKAYARAVLRDKPKLGQPDPDEVPYI
jgi:hypothetical protein